MGHLPPAFTLQVVQNLSSHARHCRVSPDLGFLQPLQSPISAMSASLSWGLQCQTLLDGVKRSSYSWAPAPSGVPGARRMGVPRANAPKKAAGPLATGYGCPASLDRHEEVKPLRGQIEGSASQGPRPVRPFISWRAEDDCRGIFIRTRSTGESSSSATDLRATSQRSMVLAFLCAPSLRAL